MSYLRVLDRRKVRVRIVQIGPSDRFGRLTFWDFSQRPCHHLLWLTTQQPGAALMRGGGGWSSAGVLRGWQCRRWLGSPPGLLYTPAFSSMQSCRRWMIPAKAPLVLLPSATGYALCGVRFSSASKSATASLSVQVVSVVGDMTSWAV